MIPNRPSFIHIVGRKHSGKTALAAAIISELTGRGFRVGGVRHSPHSHTVDPGGTDTECLRRAGACGTALITAGEVDLFTPAEGWQEKITCLENMFFSCHLVVMEGGMKHGRDKIEVVPDGMQPLCYADRGLLAVVGDSGGQKTLPCFAPGDITKICDFIEARYLRGTVSAAVLAGGKSSRLGENKALKLIGGRRIIDFVLETVRSVVPNVMVITNNPEAYPGLNVPTAPDVRPGCGPLSGIHAALVAAPADAVLVTSCDIPLVQPDHLKKILSACTGSDIVIYKHRRFEPLCAVYRRSCLPALEDLIDHDECRIIDLFATLSVRVIRTNDEESFRSLNTEKDYACIVEKIRRCQIGHGRLV